MLAHARATSLAAQITSLLRASRQPMSLGELTIRTGVELTSVGCATLWPILNDSGLVQTLYNTDLLYRPKLAEYNTPARMLAHLRSLPTRSAPLQDVLDVFPGEPSPILPHILVLGGRAYEGSKWSSLAWPLGRASGWSRLLVTLK